MIELFSKTQQKYIELGAEQDARLSKIVKKSVGVIPSLVRAKRHTIISGPPGNGKSYTVFRELNKTDDISISLSDGASIWASVVKLATAVYSLKEGQKVNLIIDDADSAVFSPKSINKWKVASQDDEPAFVHDVNVVNQIEKLRSTGKTLEADACDSFQNVGEVGIRIPMDDVRIMIICNKNYVDPSVVSKGMRDHVEAFIDRFDYQRLDFDWHVAWGWLINILDNDQPFEEEGFNLTDKQKYIVGEWMWDKWQNMRNTSYRTIREMCAIMIEEPDDYKDIWAHKFLKGEF